VTGLVSEIDRLYPDDFALLPFKGYAEEHALTLDLGDLDEGSHYVLLLYGFVDYADSSANLAASQAGVKLVPPYLEVGSALGAFRKVLPQMGFPAGLPKTMLVDLAGLVSKEENRVRITTSMRLYWDRISIARVAAETRITVTELEPVEAELGFLGYPAPLDPDGRKPVLYTYDRILPRELWGAHEGDYTRYGDVTPLVLDVDDRYVVTHHGDELRLGFAESALPPLAPGFERTFLVVADGFGKDMDLSSAHSDTVAPYPYHAMPSYPYPPEADRGFRDEYQTRHVSKDGANPFGR
jgi:hypothetical protein